MVILVALWRVHNHRQRGALGVADQYRYRVLCRAGGVLRFEEYEVAAEQFQGSPTIAEPNLRRPSRDGVLVDGGHHVEAGKAYRCIGAQFAEALR